MPKPRITPILWARSLIFSKSLQTKPPFAFAKAKMSSPFIKGELEGILRQTLLLHRCRQFL
jgi:hypothetical protein